MLEDSTRSYSQLPGIHISSDESVLLPLSLKSPIRPLCFPPTTRSCSTTYWWNYNCCCTRALSACLFVPSFPFCCCKETKEHMYYTNFFFHNLNNNCLLSESLHNRPLLFSLSLSLSLTKSFLKTLKPSHTSEMKKGKFGGSSASNPLLLILHALVWTKSKLHSLSVSLCL